MDEAENGKKQKKPGSQPHYRPGLKGDEKLPEKVGSFQVVDEAEDSDDDRKGGDVRPDPDHSRILFFSEKIGHGGDGEGPGAHPGDE